MIRIIPLAAPAEPSLAPDILFDGLMGDFALAETGEAGNRGGLRARAQLETAVLICLMTDARAEPDELRDGDVNRGWHGDSYDLDQASGEAPIGSKLWLLRRRAVDDVHVPRLAEAYAVEACRTLVRQGAVAKVTAAAVADPARNRLELTITLTNRTGAVVTAPKFDILWSNLNGISAANA